jgi:hypothetical protein
MNPIKYIKKFKEAVMFPTGINEAWDKECEKSFGKFLDIVYYFSISLFFIYGFVMLFALTHR